MEQQTSIFALFGGIRPMARELDERPSNVASWKSVDRIPAEKQPHVLEIGLALGLPITAELVIFPSGHVPEAIARAARQDVPHASSPASPGATATFHAVDRTGGAKYGKARGGLHTCEQMASA